MQGGASLGTAVVNFAAEHQQFTGALSTMGTGLSDLGNKVTSIGNTAAGFGAKMAGLGTAIAGSLSVAIKAAAGFEQKLAEVSTMMGETTKKEVDELGESLQDIAVLYGQKLPDVLKGAYDSLSASVPGDEVVGFLEQSAKTAVAGVSDIATSVDVLTTIVNSYGSKLDHLGGYTEKAERISDMLFMTLKGGKTTFEELAGSISQVATIAAEAGVTLDELGAMFGTMTYRGMNAANASTAIRGMLMELSRATGDSLETFEEAGIEVGKFQQKQISLSEILKQVSAATGGSNAEMAKYFHNMRAMLGVTVLVADEMKAWDRQIGLQAESLGSRDAAFQKMAETVQHKLNQAFAAGRNALIAFGSSVSGTDGLIEAFTKKMEALTDSIRRNQEFLGNWTGFILKLSIALIGLGTALVVFGKIAAAIGSIITLFGKLSAAGITLTAMWGKLTGAVTAVGAAIAAIPAKATAALAALKGLGAAIAGLTAAGAATITIGVVVTAGTFVLIERNISLLKDLWELRKKLKEQERDLGKYTDQYIESLMRQGKITKDQAAELSAIHDVEERRQAALNAQAEYQDSKNKEFHERAIQQIKERLGEEATAEEQLREYRRLAKEDLLYKEGEALKVKEEATARIKVLEKDLTEATEEEIEERVRLLANYQTEQQMHESDRIAYANAQLMRLGEERATEEELATIKEIAAEREIALIDAIHQLRAGVAIEEIGLIKEVTRAKQDALSFDEEQLKQQELNLDELREHYRNAYEEMKIHVTALTNERREAAERLREIENQVREEGRQLTEEEKAERRELMDLVNAYTHAITIAGNTQLALWKEWVALATSTSPAIATAMQESAQAEKTARDNSIKGSIAAIQANEEFINSVLSGIPKVKAEFDSLSQAEQMAMKGIIVAAQQAGHDVPQAMEYMTADFENIKQRAFALAIDYENAMQSIGASNLEMLPRTEHSPSPLSMFLEDMGIITGRTFMLVQDTQGATGMLHSLWDGFAMKLDWIMHEAWEAMQWLNPFARHSPSLVDNVKQGTSEILNQWGQASKDLLPIMQSAYDAMTYLDPSQRHSPSLIDRILAGWNYLTQEEEKTLRNRIASFVNNNKKMLENLKAFYSTGRNLSVQWSTGMTYDWSGKSASTPQLIGQHPSWLTGRSLDALLNKLQVQTSFLNRGESKSTLLDILGSALGQSSRLMPPTKPKGLTYKETSFNDFMKNYSPSYTPPPSTSYTPSYDREYTSPIYSDYQSDYLTSTVQSRIADVVDEISMNVSGIALAVTGENAETKREEAIPQELHNTVNIYVDQLRSDADIKALAKQASIELEKLNWRSRS